jgi:hypothetical protein
MTPVQAHLPYRTLAAVGLSFGLACLLDACGGSGDPLNNPPLVANAAGATSQSLSFDYFQRCVNPVFLASLPNPLDNGATSNTCSSAGCHADSTGRGGAFRIIASAAIVDVTTHTPAYIQTQDMYRNFLSAQGEVVVDTPTQSLLVNKPLLRDVSHGGGLIFSSAQDAHVQLMEYWITHPMPAGEDEFGSSANLFTDGACNTG